VELLKKTNEVVPDTDELTCGQGTAVARAFCGEGAFVGRVV
jgi:hypothetical protein